MCTQQARIVKFLLKEIFDNLCVDSEANDNTQSGPDLVGARHARPRKSMILNVSVSNVRTKGDMRRSVMTRTRDFLHWRWKLCRIHFLSLFYNDHLNGDYVFDTVMQPAFWFVDHCTAAVGPVFVAVVMFLTVRAVVRRNGQIGDERLTEPTIFRCVHCLLGWATVLCGKKKLDPALHPGSPRPLSSYQCHLPLFPRMANLTWPPTHQPGAGTSDDHLQEMHCAEATQDPPLQRVQRLRAQDGSSLPLA